MARVHAATGDDPAERRIGEYLTGMTTTLRGWLESHPPAITSAGNAVSQLLDLFDAEALGRYVKSTTPGDDLDFIINAFQARLAEVITTSVNWTDALDQFEAVVLLTAHRSKGLEYHTVIFLGLDDRQWWSHERDPDGSTSTFFVGLSRAAHRLIFTTTSPDARSGLIADFFTMLDSAGVAEIDLG